MLTTWLGVLNAAFAGAFVITALLGLSIYRRDAGGSSFLWASGLSLLLAVVMAAGAISIGREGATAYPVSLGVRDVVQGVAAAVAVRTLAGLVPAMRARWLAYALVAVFVVHAVLLLGTNLVVEYPLAPGTDPVRGPLGSIVVLYGVGTATAGVLAAVRGDRGVRRWLAGVAPFVFAAAVTSMVLPDATAKDEFTTLASAAVGLGVLGLSARRMTVVVRRRDALQRRETGLTGLAFLAVEQSDVEIVTAAAQQLLRTELGDGTLVVRVGSAPVSPDAVSVRTGGDVISVSVTSLGEDERPLVDTALRLVAGAVGRARAEDEIRRQSTHHPVTGLPNQVLFVDRLEARLAVGAPVMVVVCRIRGLDTLAAVDGLGAEDIALRAVAESLRASIGSHRMLAQLSSGLFGILSPVRLPVTDPVTASRITERLTFLHDLITRDVQAFGLDVSIGAAISTDCSNADQLLRDATAALARAAERGTVYEVFDADLGDRLRGTATLARRLGKAVARDEVEVRYQPVVDARTRVLSGFEALARWRDAGSIVEPATWIPVAEVHGLINDIGRRVLTLAGRDHAALATHIAVNVSPLQLASQDFAATVLTAIGSTPPTSLVVEVTEGAVMRDLGHSITQLAVLRSAGVRVALDDFGTSYSSLSALADLPVDILKIDRSFAARLDTTAGRAVVQAVVTMARALDKLTVAEGVETALQFAQLAELGVDRIQGYYVARPMPLSDALSWPVAPSPYRRATDGPV